MSMAHHEPSLDVSVVVPLLDEQDSLKELRQRIGEAMAGLSYEVIFVDDGSTSTIGRKFEIRNSSKCVTRLPSLSRFWDS